jgi:hypothetical protein
MHNGENNLPSRLRASKGTMERECSAPQPYRCRALPSTARATPPGGGDGHTPGIGACTDSGTGTTAPPGARGWPARGTAPSPIPGRPRRGRTGPARFRTVLGSVSLRSHATAAVLRPVPGGRHRRTRTGTRGLGCPGRCPCDGGTGTRRAPARCSGSITSDGGRRSVQRQSRIAGGSGRTGILSGISARTIATRRGRPSVQRRGDPGGGGADGEGTPSGDGALPSAMG